MVFIPYLGIIWKDYWGKIRNSLLTTHFCFFVFQTEKEREIERVFHNELYLEVCRRFLDKRNCVIEEACEQTSKEIIADEENVDKAILNESGGD